MLGSRNDGYTHKFLKKYVKTIQNLAKTHLKPLQLAGNPKIRTKKDFSKIKNSTFFRLAAIPAGKTPKTASSSIAWTPHEACETVCASSRLPIVFNLKYHFNNDQSASVSSRKLLKIILQLTNTHSKYPFEIHYHLL